MGSEEQYMAAIVNHMIDIGHFLLGHHIPPQYCSFQDYIQDKGMDQPHIWGTEINLCIHIIILIGVGIPLIM